jgi:NAD(P)-dependent dehydrogenase (short-subunit alcohol dehydrogenase family)
MAKRQWGRVIAIGSLMGEQGGFAEGAYAAAKAGLVGLVRTMALEYGRFGVTANVVVPGRIATTRTAAGGERASEAMKRIAQHFIAVWKGQKYLTVVYQIDQGMRRLLWVGRDRTKVCFRPLLAEAVEERSGVPGIAAQLTATKRCPFLGLL